jgi:hypothetical protein
MAIITIFHQIQPFIESNNVRHISYQMPDSSWHTGFGCGMSCQDIRLTAGISVRQGMLTPSKNLIPPLVYPGTFCLTLEYIRFMTYETE